MELSSIEKLSFLPSTTPKDCCRVSGYMYAISKGNPWCMHLECRGMYISATTTLVGREEADADALFTLASDWSDSTAKSELVSNRGLKSTHLLRPYVQNAEPIRGVHGLGALNTRRSLRRKQRNTTRHTRAHTYNLTRPKALLHVVPCVSSDENSVKKGAAASTAAAFVAL